MVTSGGEGPGVRRPIEILIPRDASEPREAARGSEAGGGAAGACALEALDEPSGSEVLDGASASASASSARDASCLTSC